MKRLFIIILLILGLGTSVEYVAQTGGRKREGGSKRRGGLNLKRTRSAGHADKFARAKGRKGMFARLFKRNNSPAWVYRTTGSKKSNARENRFLFFRHRSVGKTESSTYLDRQNARREKRRNHGNESFGSKKKYKRRK